MTSLVVRGFVPVPGGRIFYEAAGQGSTVVLVHAGIVDRRMWDPQFENFAPHHRVVRYDVRGFGRSIPSTGPYADHEDLFALLHLLGADHVALVGVSNGGRIALDFAVEHPRMVDRLVLGSSGLGGFVPSHDASEESDCVALGARIAEIERTAAQDGIPAGVEELLRLWGPALSPPRRAWVATLITENGGPALHDLPDVMPLAPPAASRLAALRVPVLLLAAPFDPPAMEWIGRRLLRDLPNARRVSLPGADHFLNLSAESEFDRNVLAFLDPSLRPLPS
jgi:pimeloyl-ACP methyl ester carboxylesterase